MPLLDRYDCLLLDLDGVLYRGDRAVRGVAETLEAVRAAGRRVVFLTNNSSRTPEEVAAKLAGMGVGATADEVVTSALATATLLRARGGGSVFVIGEGGIRAALADAGLRVLRGAPRDADYVVVGWDRTADYEKLKIASLLVQRGADLVATNADPSYPAPDGEWPGAGALLAAIATTTGATAEVVGKPHPPLFEMARARAGGGRPLVVGDRLTTDVAGAAALGWDSLLVFTGVTRPADLLAAAALPTFVGPDLSVLRLEVPEVRAARPEDAAALRELLAASGLDSEGVEARLEDTVVAADGRQVRGAASVEVFGPVAHLRSVAVDRGVRGRGLGALLVAHAVRRARAVGASDLYLVTEGADGFFASLGFDRIGTKEALPQRIRDLPLVRDRCPATAVAMGLALGRPPG